MDPNRRFAWPGSCSHCGRGFWFVAGFMGPSQSLYSPRNWCSCSDHQPVSTPEVSHPFLPFVAPPIYSRCLCCTYLSHFILYGHTFPDGWFLCQPAGLRDYPCWVCHPIHGDSVDLGGGVCAPGSCFVGGGLGRETALGACPFRAEAGDAHSFQCGSP